MTTRQPDGYPPYHEPNSVNLLRVHPVPVWYGGYYLFSTPRSSGERVGVVLAVREQNRINYARAHPPHWRSALAAFIQ